MAKRTTERPRLHLVRGDNDPGLYCEDLAWFFQVLDSVSGHRSCMGGQIAVLNEIAGGGYATESNFYSDQQAGWPWMLRPECRISSRCTYFGKSRRIWQTLQLIEGVHTAVLAVHYEQRAYWPPERKPPPEAAVRAAHAAYYAAKEARKAGAA